LVLHQLRLFGSDAGIVDQLAHRAHLSFLDFMIYFGQRRTQTPPPSRFESLAAQTGLTRDTSRR
jgi:hypothetical protein